MLAGRPPALAQGSFAWPAPYPVVLRSSTSPGDILDDSISSPRGLALKVIGVDGARHALAGAAGGPPGGLLLSAVLWAMQAMIFRGRG
jgi:hypothetical protein